MKTKTLEFNNIQQTFCWIPPGKFLMGSPESEPGRFEDEGPQHEVTISKGFWMADTTCTQELWKAVMGYNPSQFKGPDRPVEMVSWDDVQRFLEELPQEYGADLPTEAEWEYACRAGTQTPFNLGTSLGSDQANFYGAFPYGEEQNGGYCEKTVPVRSFAPNDWGLYEMHGNVWEWCADGQREYDNQPVVDPRGLEDGRVRRGGSWVLTARIARSAFRNTFHPSSADNDLGFRFCLRTSN